MKMLLSLLLVAANAQEGEQSRSGFDPASGIMGIRNVFCSNRRMFRTLDPAHLNLTTFPGYSRMSIAARSNMQEVMEGVLTFANTIAMREVKKCMQYNLWAMAEYMCNPNCDQVFSQVFGIWIEAIGSNNTLQGGGDYFSIFNATHFSRMGPYIEKVCTNECPLLAALNTLRAPNWAGCTRQVTDMLNAADAPGGGSQGATSTGTNNGGSSNTPSRNPMLMFFSPCTNKMMDNFMAIFTNMCGRDAASTDAQNPQGKRCYVRHQEWYSALKAARPDYMRLGIPCNIMQGAGCCMGNMVDWVSKMLAMERCWAPNRNLTAIYTQMYKLITLRYTGNTNTQYGLGFRPHRDVTVAGCGLSTAAVSPATLPPVQVTAATDFTGRVVTKCEGATPPIPTNLAAFFATIRALPGGPRTLSPAYAYDSQTSPPSNEACMLLNWMILVTILIFSVLL